MKVSDITLGQSTVIVVEPKYDADFGKSISIGTDVKLYYSEGADQYFIQIEEGVFSINGVDDDNERKLDYLISQNLARLGWIAGSFPKDGLSTKLVLHFTVFPLSYFLQDQISIGITEKIVEQVSKEYLPSRNTADITAVIDWLREKTIIRSDFGTYIMISAGVNKQPGVPTSFTIHGDGIQVDITTQSPQDYRVIRVARRRSMRDMASVTLLTGDIDYGDATAAKSFLTVGKSILDGIVRQADSYLNLWQKYNELEQKEIFREIKEFGWIEYEGLDEREDGVVFSLAKNKSIDAKLTYLIEHIGDGLQLEVNSAVPSYLFSDSEIPNGFLDDSKTLLKGVIGELRRVDPDSRELTLVLQNIDDETELAPMGFIYLPFAGDQVRLQRREEARDKIANANTPLPWLAMLLEDGGVIPSPHYRRIRVAKKDVRMIFGGEPTMRQMDALDVALNTPDIALIQGPPGTGKTRVIAALAEILTDYLDASDISGQILITSYQHDAVENAASRTRVMGLPAIKVGKRYGDESARDAVESWKNELLHRLNKDLEKYPSLPATTVLRYVQQRAIAYHIKPSGPLETSRMLRDILGNARDYLSIHLSERLWEVGFQMKKQKYQYHVTPEKKDMLRAVLALRYTEAGFMDDGPENALRLLLRLENEKWFFINDYQRKLLKEAGGLQATPPPVELLEELNELRNQLLDELVDTSVLDQSSWRNELVEDLLRKVINELTQYVKKSRDGVESAIIEFRDELNYDPVGVRKTLNDYTAVLAATCQQATGWAMHEIKDDIEFDTVIIDEAARANPLDLFIPMSKAKRRIILVGDHRQLPHILEPNVERELQKSEKSTRNKLRESLFERLWIRAEELQRIDGVQRRVSLDSQYRMHPILGNFVSETFYAKYGEQFFSPLPAETFAHNLHPYENKVAVWKNIPIEEGIEFGQHSKYRPSEAAWIAKEAKRILKETPNYSVGVITFYAAQKEEILRQMFEVGLVEDTSGAGLQISREWREYQSQTGEIIERLRVGTVDAFQGKEFDIVLLSLVRSNTERANLRRKYGFLALENRLVVAMSRQKRLLIVVGDLDMVLNEAATKEIPGLRAFYELCEGEHGLVL